MRILRFAGMWLLIATVAFGAKPPPGVTKIEPPNWWPGHSVNPVRLLVSGTNLTGVSVEAPDGFVASNLIASTNGSFLFVDVQVPDNAQPGRVPLRFVAGSNLASAEFKLLAPLPSAQRFAGFSPDDVIYLVLPDRFANGDRATDRPPQSPDLLDRSKPRHYHGGDFQGIIDHLPYLKELGVTALWLTPWYDNVNHLNTQEKYSHDNQRSARGHPVTDYHGYGAVNFYGVEEHFGNLQKLRELVDLAHNDGFKMIQDQVANHTGPYHPWVKNPPTPTWFNGSSEQHLDNSWQTWTTAEPNPPEDKLKSTLEGWFINILPDLNQTDPETAKYLIQNSLWWIGMAGVDAVRQDTLPYVPRTYWSEWTTALKRQYPNLTILGEFFDGNPKLVSFFQGGRKQFDGVDSGVGTLFDFPLYFAMRDVFAKGQPVSKLTEALAADTNYVNPRVLVTFLGLHDTPRFMSEPGASVDGLKLAFTFLLTSRGTPMIYYGDEIAMNGGGDPYNRADFPGGWPEDRHNAFTTAGRTASEENVHAHVRKLLTLRRELDSLRRGDMVFLKTTGQTIAYARSVGDSSTIVAINNSEEPQLVRLKLPDQLLGKVRWQNRLPGSNSLCSANNGVLSLQLPSRSAALFVPQSPAVASDQPETTANLR